MAAQVSRATGPKKSFASVAAMAPPAQSSNVNLRHDEKTGRSGNPLSVPTARSIPPKAPAASQLSGELPESMSHLDTKDEPTLMNEPLNPEVNGNLQVRPKLDDEKTHLSSSSTKPASLDGKSVTSGTTFAMDEKESLRPDDSASIKAADEDDSGPASGAPSSQVGSEAGGKAFQSQLHEISERMGPGGQRSMPLGRRIALTITEDAARGVFVPLVATTQEPVIMPRPDITPVISSSFVYQYKEPDEKLIEALESPKDRLFLLQLEQQVISFIRDSQDPILDLPPCNSFCRLLAHRLGDYYALTHYVDNAVSAVRLYRTPYCRLPAPLSAFSKQSSNGENSSAGHPSMKIMRRAGLGMDGLNTGSGFTTNSNSLGPSKAGSETGDDGQRMSGVTSPTESMSAKDKASMTREEREAKYKETRDRIFKGFDDVDNTEATPGIEPPNEESRTSSTTGKKKPKKKQNNDDGFEARSLYNAYYPSMQYSATQFDQPTPAAAFFNPYMPQMNSQAPQPTMPQAFDQAYATMQGYQGYQPLVQQPNMVNAPMYQQNGVSGSLMQYGQQAHQQYYQTFPQLNPLIAQAPQVSSPTLSNGSQVSRPQSQMSDQHWSQNQYQNPYQMLGGQQLPYQTQPQQQMQQPQLQNNLPATNLPTVQYPYGQLPCQPNLQGGRSPHPLPGSYNRQTFNPQTRAFVPGNGFSPQQPNAYGNRLSEAATYRSAPLPIFQGGNTNQFGQHQMSNPQMSHVGQSLQPNNNRPQASRKPSGKTPRSQSPGQSSLSKWGTPSTLPPKPPPPEVPSKQGSGNNQNATGMPTYQNGTYSKPGNVS